MIKYKIISNNLLKDLSPRVQNVIERRFGLNGKNRETLESIGKSFQITRERVRQIEEEGLSRARAKIKNYPKAFQAINKTLESFGGIKKEDVLIEYLGNKKHQNQALFLLTLSDNFKKIMEDSNYHTFWFKDKKSADRARKAAVSAVANLKKEKRPLNLDEFFKIQRADIKNIFGKAEKNIFSSCLEISKNIQVNSEGQFGLKHWVEINPKGIKDKAYVVFKKEEKPLHFTKVAFLIEKYPCFKDKKVHKATVHNELIKDSRFVLVGRGIYALTEWGYEPGVVKDIVLKVLKESKKPLFKEEIVEKVSAQRFVKANTIVLNLQDKDYFFKDNNGKYKVKKA